MDEPIKGNNRIIITSVTGGDTKDQIDLLKCYFEEYGSPGNYRMYNQAGEHIQTAPVLLRDDTKTFRFITGGFLWKVDNFKIDNVLPISTAGGHWINDHEGPAQDDGEFHAQSGGGGAEEASYATA
jgi:hypothetical protein